MREKKEGKKKEKDEIERERGEKKKRKKREWVIYKKGRREGGAKDRKDEKKKEKKRVNLYSHFSHMPDEESLIQIKAVVQVVVTKFLPNVHAIVTCMKNKKKKIQTSIFVHFTQHTRHVTWLEMPRKQLWKFSL